jgi:aldehyde dehydrogenase (NAD+)
MFKNFIGGDWVDATDGVDNVNPSDTNDVIGVFARADAAQVDGAVAAARDAFPSWSRSTPQVRHDILKRASDEVFSRTAELGRILSREEGKTLAEGVGEATRAAQVLDFFAGECLRLGGEAVPSVRPGVGVEVTREAVGVVGMITPWNFPIAIPAWKIAPALAWGNTVVFKPAELVPHSAWMLVDILNRAGLPPGVLNLVMGKGSVVGQRLVEHPDVAAITFTGSVGTGRGVAAGCVASAPVMKKVHASSGDIALS